MASITLASYTVKVRPHLEERLQPLGSCSVYDSIKKTLEVLQQHGSQSETSRRVAKVSQLTSDGTDLWGLIESGDYGFTARLVNAEDLAPRFNRKVSDAELIPLYFRFHLPANINTGVLIAQRFGAHGAFTDLSSAAMDDFRHRNPAHILMMPAFVPAGVLEAVRQSAVKEVKIQTYTCPPDLASWVESGATKDEGTYELVWKAKRNNSLSLPDWLMARRGSLKHSAVEFPEDVANVKVRVDFKGRSRTYDFHRRRNVVPYTEISDEVETNAEGHPDFDSIDEHCIKLRDELIEQIGEED